LTRETEETIAGLPSEKAGTVAIPLLLRLNEAPALSFFFSESCFTCEKPIAGMHTNSKQIITLILIKMVSDSNRTFFAYLPCCFISRR
jgi:hypothetical protein